MRQAGNHRLSSLPGTIAPEHNHLPIRTTLRFIKNRCETTVFPEQSDPRAKTGPEIYTVLYAGKLPNLTSRFELQNSTRAERRPTPRPPAETRYLGRPGRPGKLGALNHCRHSGPTWSSQNETAWPVVSSGRCGRSWSASCQPVGGPDRFSRSWSRGSGQTSRRKPPVVPIVGPGRCHPTGGDRGTIVPADVLRWAVSK